VEICKVEGCDNKYYGLGFCNKHWQRFKKYGDPLYVKMRRHGLRHTPEYKVWDSMIQRCTNKNHTAYHRYGGRGICVWNRWVNSFQTFYEEMGPKPFPKATIDRINNDGNYEPNNCEWVSQLENSRHTSTTHLTMSKAREIRLKYKKGDITQKELGSMYGVNRLVIHCVVNNKTWRES